MLLARDTIANFIASGVQTKDEWVDILCDSIRFGSLPAFKGQVSVVRNEGAYDEYLSKSYSDLDMFDHVNKHLTMLTRTDLRSWCAENNLNPEFLLENMLPDADNKADRSTGLVPAAINHIQKLMDGTHERQAPELAIALRAWLELAQKDMTAPLPGGIRNRVGTWLRKHAPQIEEDSAADKRIQTIANWNKS